MMTRMIVCRRVVRPKESGGLTIYWSDKFFVTVIAVKGSGVMPIITVVDEKAQVVRVWGAKWEGGRRKDG